MFKFFKTRNKLHLNRQTPRKPHSNIRRVIGLSLDDETPIFEPNTSLSWIVYGGAGSGKTTCSIIPSIQSLIADHERGQVINDVKLEIAHQIADMCLKYNRKFAVIDDSYSMGENYPHRVCVNPMSNLIAAFERKSPNLLLDIISFSRIVIKEPDNDPKNFYFRQTPREFLILAIYILLGRDPDLVTPGGVTALLSDPDIWHSAIDIEAEEGGPQSQSRAKQIQNMRDNDPEHYNQHYLSILSALDIFSDGGPMHEAGRNAEITHEELLQQNYIVCICQRAKDAASLSTYYGMHLNAFLSAQMSDNCGRTIMIMDEIVSTPATEIIKKVVIFRSFKLQVIYCAQSRSDLVRQHGEKLIATLEDNCGRQYLQFANPEECERISKAIGEVDNVNYSLNETTGKIDLSRTISTGRERRFSADALASLQKDEQILLVPNVGCIPCKLAAQNNLFPYAHDLADNPQEGGKLAPDCKVILPVHYGDKP